MKGRLKEFKEQGYTIFKELYTQETMEKWKAAYYDLLERHPAMERERTPETGAQVVLDNMVEREPRLMLSAVTHPQVWDFLESVMGPFVQMESLRLNRTDPVTKADSDVQATNWHRDGWALFAGQSNEYFNPLAVNVLTYLQDLTDDVGPLRVIPESHRRNIFISRENSREGHPDEKVIRLSAGDTVILHSVVLHSASPNLTRNPRFFLSRFYTRCFLPRRDNHAGPNVQNIIAEGRARNDRRLMRLFGEDDLAHRRSMSTGSEPEEVLWKKWIREDREALKGPAITFVRKSTGEEPKA